MARIFVNIRAKIKNIKVYFIRINSIYLYNTSTNSMCLYDKEQIANFNTRGYRNRKIALKLSRNFRTSKKMHEVFELKVATRG